MSDAAQAVIRTVDSRQRIQNIRLNVVFSESHTIANTVTRAPVDGEADRAQHVITQPREVAINAVVSKISDSFQDTPLGVFTYPLPSVQYPNSPPAIPSEIPNLSRPAPQVSLGRQWNMTVSIPPNSAADNASTFWARLNALNDSKELFEYTSDLGVYRDMVFDTIEVIRDEREWIEFNAVMVEFRVTGVTRNRWLSEDQLNDSGDKANEGTRTTKDAAFEAPLPDVRRTARPSQASQSSTPP